MTDTLTKTEQKYQPYVDKADLVKAVLTSVQEELNKTLTNDVVPLLEWMLGQMTPDEIRRHATDAAATKALAKELLKSVGPPQRPQSRLDARLSHR